MINGHSFFFFCICFLGSVLVPLMHQYGRSIKALHAKQKSKQKETGEILPPSSGHLSANHKLSTGDFCFSLHGVISRDCVSTNISLYCLWTKKIFVIFSAFLFCFFCSLSMFLNRGKDKRI